MAIQQNEDFVSYSVTCMRKNSILLRFDFLLCDWYDK